MLPDWFSVEGNLKIETKDVGSRKYLPTEILFVSVLYYAIEKRCNACTKSSL